MGEVKVEGVVVPADATVESRPDLFGVRGQFRPDGQGGLLTYMNSDDKPEYATPEASGVERGMFTGSRGLPWHVALSRQLNTPALMAEVDELQTAEQALDASGLNITYRLEPMTLQSDPTNVVPGKFASVRGDTNIAVGVVGRSYRLHQPVDAFQWADNLVDTGEAKYETAALMRGGAWMFLSAELNHLEISVPGDPSSMKTYLVIRTAFDGTAPTTAMITRVRFVCRNTCELGTRTAISRFSVRHTGNLERKLQQARDALGIAFRNTEYVREITAKLASTSLVDEQIADIFEKTWPRTAEDAEQDEEKLSRHAREALVLYEMSPNLDGIRGTAWGAFNTVTELLDHGIKYGGRNASETRGLSLMFGRSAQTKATALKLLLAAAK